MNKIRMTVL